MLRRASENGDDDDVDIDDDHDDDDDDGFLAGVLEIKFQLGRSLI